MVAAGLKNQEEIIRNTDGTYTFAGATLSSNQQVGSHAGGSYDTWVVKISSTGSIIWKKIYGGKGFDYCNAMAITSDGNIVLGQVSTSTDGDVNGSGSAVMWLLKINPQSGDIIWSKTFSGSTQGTACFGIVSTADGGVISLVIPDQLMMLPGMHLFSPWMAMEIKNGQPLLVAPKLITPKLVFRPIIMT